jgi:UDP-2,4-diacetamido-2,4,6-trideoxy-beta-L-altropyranose hydrolase
LNLIMRADASSAIGSGHVMRCLALAEGWRDLVGGDVAFVSASLAGWFLDRLANDGISVMPIESVPGGMEDAELTLAASASSGAKWIVTDGYAFDDGYQRAIKTGPARHLFIDDYGHCTDYSADIVLNQNLHANDGMYRHRHDNVRLLLGPRYVLLRREFRGAGLSPRETTGIGTRVLVTLGGGDPENVTTTVVDALSDVPVENLEAVVAVGPNNPHEAVLRRTVEALPLPARLEYAVENMVPLMQWADLAICGGGSTCWELARMGVPSVVLVLAENQRPIAEALAAVDAAENLGWHSDLGPDAVAEAVGRLAICSERRAALSRQGRELVDGSGVDRVIGALHEAEP